MFSANIFAQFGQYVGAGSATTKLLYHLNGNSTDVSGNSNNGTDANITYSLANGKFNQGAGFNGSSSKITSASNSGISGDVVFTISFWYKPSAQATTIPILQFGVGSNSVYTNVTIFNGYQQLGDLCVMWKGGASGWTCTTSNTLIQNNIWNYITIVKTAGNPRTTTLFYVNGILYGNAATGSTTTPNITNSKFILGYDTLTNLWGVFSIDEIVVDNVAWDAIKINKILTMGKGRFGIN